MSNITNIAPDTIGWGETINNNFSNLNNDLVSLQNKVLRLQNLSGGMGLYYVDPYYGSEIDGDGKVNGVLINEVYNELLDGTMFVAIEDHASTPTLSLEYKKHDIIVKTSVLRDGVRTNSLIKLPQSMGGFYKLVNYASNASNKPVAQYTRVSSISDTAETDMDAPVLYMRPVSVNNNRITFKLESYNPNNAQQVTTYNGSTWTISYPQMTEESWTVQINSSTEEVDTGIRQADYNCVDVTFTSPEWPTSNFLMSYQIGLSNSNTWKVLLPDAERLTPGLQYIMTVRFANRMTVA